MSRTSITIGIIAAVALHGLLFVPSATKSATPKPQPKKMVVLRPVPSQPQQRPPASTAANKTRPQAPSEVPQNVVSSAANKTDSPGNTATTEGNDDNVPPLVITWKSPQQLRRVAGRLGLKVVAVNAAGKVVGEIPSEGKLRIASFGGNLSHFSNRVRTLPRGFFGADINLASVGAASLWILVPGAVDRELIAVQQAAILQTGVSAGSVQATEARFEDADGRFKLVITRVVHS